MKKIIASAALALFGVVSLAACAGSTEEPSSSDQSEIQGAEDSVGGCQDLITLLDQARAACQKKSPTSRPINNKEWNNVPNHCRANTFQHFTYQCS